jgi:flagellar protein FlaJ
MSLGTPSGHDPETDALADAFYPLYKLLFGESSDFVGDVERKLTEARMGDTVEHYLSRALAIGTILGGLLWVVGSLLGYSLFRFGLITPETVSLGIPVSTGETAALLRGLVIPAVVGVAGIVFGSIGFGVGFGGLVTIPYMRAGERKRNINILLPDAISFMYALSVGGLNQLEILRAMADAEDTYDEIAREFQSIVNETEYFGTDYRNAIRKQSMETPSEPLAQFLTDMLSIVNSGGDMESFLKDKKNTHMRTAKQQQEMTLETLELFGEMYMTLSLFPLLLVIIQNQGEYLTFQGQDESDNSPTVHRRWQGRIFHHS